MKLRNVLLSMTAAGMLVTPIAAQAGTTASASTGKIASLSGVGERKSVGVKAKQKAEAGTIVLAAVGLGAAVAGGIVLADDDNKSNGS